MRAVLLLLTMLFVMGCGQNSGSTSLTPPDQFLSPPEPGEGMSTGGLKSSAAPNSRADQ
jgi:hypothetical protein